MSTIKRDREMGTEKKHEGAAPKNKLRTLTVRSGVTAGLRRMGCTPCHTPSNHNETLVER